MMHRFPALVVALLCCASLADARAVVAQGARLPHAGRTPVAARDLARGTVLAAGDIAWTDSISVDFPARDSVQAGWVARRPFLAGQVLEPPGVSRPELVSSGDAVNVIYTAPGIAITLRGTAVGSGAQGDEVYVRLDNRRRLRGVVAGANTVRVM